MNKLTYFSAPLRRIGLFGLSFFLLIGLYISLLSVQGNQQGVAYAQSAPNAQGRLAVVGAQGADLYDLPDGAVLQSLTPGATLTAVGRTADSLWVVVQTDDGDNGWVKTASIVIFGTNQLPVMEDIPTHAPTATPATVTTSATSTTTVAATVAPTPTVAPPTATPTLTPSPTPLPATPTPVPPTPTPQPTATATSILGIQSDLIAVVGSTGATLSASPGGEELRTLATGTALSANGRTADGSAIFVEMTDGTTGWVEVKDVVVFNVKNLPVRDDVANTEGDVEGDVTDTAPITETASATDSVAMTDTAPITGTEAVTEATVANTGTNTVANPVTTTAQSTQALRATPVANGQPTAQVAMTGSRLNIRSGPGTTFAIVAKALPREIFTVRGRNSDSTWVQLDVPDITAGFGWVAATYVTLSEAIATLPVTAEVNTAAPANVPPATATTTGNDTTPGTTIPPVDTASAVAAPAVQRTGPTGLSGKLVIQSSWGGKFYLYNLASGELTALSGGLDPAISPDGSQIAFTRIGNGNGIYLINVDGSNERKIFGERDGLMSPKWSPDGKWIVFSRNDGFYKCRNLGFGICLSDAQIIDQFNLPPVDGIVDQIFSDSDRESRPDWMIARIAANGEEYRDLAALNSARAPDWNENGIVYQSTGGIQITKDEGDADTQKVYFDGYDWDPDWQPNGGRIVFQSKEGPHWEIFGVNPDGSGLAALTRPVTTLVDQLPSNVSPVWSPDGNTIAYLSNRDDNNNAGAWRVWVMNADGSNQRPLPITLEINYTYNSEQMLSWGR